MVSLDTQNTDGNIIANGDFFFQLTRNDKHGVPPWRPLKIDKYKANMMPFFYLEYKIKPSF
jgi:hypothetical protein